MSMIPEVKCRRCGETFSALRSRCPNCGTRRVAQSGRTPGTTPGTVKGTASYERAETNTKWQMIFGLILVVAVILAVIVMVTTSLKNPVNGDKPKVSPTPPQEISTPPIEAPPTTPPPETPPIESLGVYYFTKQVDLEDQYPSQAVDEEIKYQAKAFPMTITGLEYKWSTDSDALELTPEDGGYCTIKRIKATTGGDKVTVECGGKTTSFLIYNRKA